LEICPKCGLQKDLCVCDILEKEETEGIRVYTTKKKFKKLVTIVEGIDESKLEETAKQLKHMLACGGSAKDGTVILQGNHKRHVVPALIKLGFPADIIKVE